MTTDPKALAILKELGLQEINKGGYAGDWVGSGPMLDVFTPVDGSLIGRVQQVNEDEYEAIVARAHAAHLAWRDVPAPKRGELVRQLAHKLREKKAALAGLVTLEMGKIIAEGEGEVQEMIDICDFAVGLSRQLYGLTMPSERPDHRIQEQWHPLGVIGVITSFNFPTAVWSWNTSLAAVCGDSVLWKPSSTTPLTAIAVTKMAAEVAAENGYDPAIFSLAVGKGSTIGERILHDRRIPLISFTGSTSMGLHVGGAVGRRLGRTILELGGNNAIIVTPHANLDMVLPAVLFGAVGTAGQRCTSTRRIIVHESVRKEFTDRLVNAYKGIRIGNPLDRSTLMGPLVTESAVQDVLRAKKRVIEEGGRILCGGDLLEGPEYPGGCYMTPCIAEAKNDFHIVQEETFGPILYIIPYGKATSTPKEAVAEMAEAMALHNGVPQGLSSSIFTEHVREAEFFLSQRGSDCGIANVNIGTSGAEIGGAFGGEKETGGGRESGSDSWKQYMRRQTNTINWSTELPLAQGLKFG